MHAGLGCSGRCNYGNDFADPYSIWVKGFRRRYESLGQYFRVSVFPISSVYFSEKQEKALIDNTRRRDAKDRISLFVFSGPT